MTRNCRLKRDRSREVERNSTAFRLPDLSASAAPLGCLRNPVTAEAVRADLVLGLDAFPPFGSTLETASSSRPSQLKYKSKLPSGSGALLFLPGTRQPTRSLPRRSGERGRTSFPRIPASRICRRARPVKAQSLGRILHGHVKPDGDVGHGVFPPEVKIAIAGVRDSTNRTRRRYGHKLESRQPKASRVRGDAGPRLPPAFERPAAFRLR